MQSTPTKASKRYGRVKQVADILGSAVSTVWQFAKNSEETGFPRPIKLSDNITVWDLDEVYAFVEARKAASRTAK